MYERMLNKAVVPTFEDLLAHSGASSQLWLALDEYLQAQFAAQRTIRFPYGNKYGWSAKYSRKTKHICDAFAENGAFLLHFQMPEAKITPVYNLMDAYAQQMWENRYPCGSGGWLSYRVTTNGQLQGAKVLLSAKMQ